VSEVVVRRAAGSPRRPLRNLVLRGVTPGAEAPYDLDPATVHIGAFDEGRCVGCVSVFPKPYDGGPPVPEAWQLRGMAVAAERQGARIGERLLDAAVAIVRAADAALLWADGRVSALGFYDRAGWETVGEVFLHGESGLPHRRILLPLR
jgi:predicted N-acetyltransferase YhbS